MADYIYLLETRLSSAQQRAIGTIRTIARENDLTIFLTGGAVRDLTGGASVRDLDLTVQGNVLGLKGLLQQAGAEIYGENTAAQRLFLMMPGGVRLELSSATSVTYPQPGKPKYEAGSLSDDLRCRDFTANAMAISLNDGSYGLLMDPLNGVADIENRELRLVSNYGFIEDPSRLIRAARLSSRLGWQMEERTRQRYDTAKEEGYISALADWNRGYELEEIFHEEDPVRILRALESQGWMMSLSPVLGSGKANMAALADLAERQGQLQTQGIFAQSAALAFPLVTAKLAPAEVVTLKKSFVRPGFVREIEGLDARTRDFGTRFASREAATPSAVWKILHDTEPNLVLSLSYSSKATASQSRLKTFLTDSPTARQRLPYVLMQEMRITPDLPDYSDLVEKLFFELMDGKLSSPEEMKAYLEPYSPPAPPPPVNLRRARAKKEARPSRAKAKKAAAVDPATLSVAAAEEAVGVAAGLMEPGTLTGPDRGSEPTPQVPLEGKVAPEPAGASLKARAKKTSGDTTAPTKTVAQKALPADPVKAKLPQPAAAKQSEPKSVPNAATTTASVLAAKKSTASVQVTAKPTALVPPKKAPAKTVIKIASKATPVGSPVPSKKAAPTKVATPPKKVAASSEVAHSPLAAKKSAAKVATAAAKKNLPATKKSVPAIAKKVVPEKRASAKAAPAKAAASKGVAAKKVVGKQVPAKKSSGRR